MPQPLWPTPLHSTLHKASAQEPLAVPTCAWYTGPRKAPHQAVTQWPLCLEGARLLTLLPAGTAISPVRMRLLNQGPLGRGAQTPEHGRVWRSREDSRSPTQDQTACSPAPTPNSRLATPALWPSVPTHNLAQTAHLMDDSWRELASLCWLDTGRNLVTVTVRDFVTVPCYRNRMPISPGDPRGCGGPRLAGVFHSGAGRRRRQRRGQENHFHKRESAGAPG